jgi:hypothetical protein
MAQEIINIGALPNDGSGDPLRVAFSKINNNFGELYLAAGAQGPEGAIQFRAPATLVGVAYVAGTYLVAAQDKLYSSTDGTSWIDLPSPFAATITGLHATDTSFILTGLAGNIYSSTDGVSWFNISLPAPVNVRNLAYSPAATPQFVVVGDAGAIYTSNNGITWTQRTSGTADDLLGVTYSNATFGWVAVGGDGIILQSADAIIWVDVGSPYSNVLRSVTHDGTSFVVVGDSGLIAASSDGAVWSTRTSGVIDDLNVINAANLAGNTWLYAFGQNGRGLSSDDNVVWNTLATGVNKNLRATDYAGNLFITVGSSGTIITSELGNIWTDDSIIPEVTGNANFIWDNTNQLLSIAGNIVPQTDNAYVLGTSSNRWADAHVFNLNATGNVNLGNVEAITIGGGSNGYMLTTDGAGNLSWREPSSGNGSPGGEITTIQYNDGGLFNGSNTFTFTAATNTVGVANLVVSETANLGNVGNVIILGGAPSYVLSTDGAGNLNWVAGGQLPGGSNSQIQFNNNGTFGGTAGLSWNGSTNTLSATNFSGNGYGIANINGANISGTVEFANVAGQVSDSAQPNITSLGTLSFLQLTGNLNSTASINANNITANGRLNVGNRFDATNTSNVALGYVGNLHITGGLNGQVLTTDGLGNLSWTTGGGGGGGSPGGSNGQIQFNNAGTFGGSAYLNWNDATNTFNVAGNLIANSVEIGSGVYRFSRSNVYFATTMTTANSELISFDCADLSGLDFTIIATNDTVGHRQISKLSAIVYQSSLNYNEYSTLVVNGQVGNFTMDYSPGNILVSPAARLYVEPSNAAMTTYKILITRYD